MATCASRNAYDLRVTEILVAEGAMVEAGQILMTLEYYKVVTEIDAPVAGVVRALCVAEGDEVQVGDPLLEIAPA